MRHRAYKYLLAYLTPAVVLFSLLSYGIWSYSALILLFGILPFIELFTKGSTQNLTKLEEEVAREDRFYDCILYSLVVIHLFLVGIFLASISNPYVSRYERIGHTIALGLSCGILGINVAHELGHRSTPYEQMFSKLLLLTSLYMHFFIEHNRGHHRNVSTDEDPASSRLGEPIYTFYLRTIWGSWRSAWELEAERLRKKGQSPWSWQNEMIQFQLIQLLFLTAIALFYGLAALGWFLVSASLGILLLETVNYIEHYGLRRAKKEGRYERVLPTHSWNSNHPLGRLVLLELTRHSDHHYIASRKYQLLRHFDNSPQMPTGYPGMMLLALIPPLWFKVMHREIRRQALSSSQT